MNLLNKKTETTVKNSLSVQSKLFQKAFYSTTTRNVFKETNLRSNKIISTQTRERKRKLLTNTNRDDITIA